MRDRHLDDEIRHHIEERIDRLVEGGMERSAARREAMRSFGDVGEVTAELRAIDADGRKAVGLIDGLAQDVSWAFRLLRRGPRFSVVTLGTLAVGIGTATAIFGLVKAVVLDALPWPDSQRIVQVQQVSPDGRWFAMSSPDFADMREAMSTFSELAAVARVDLALGGQEPENVAVARVTDGFFEVFGGRALMGRTFTADDMRAFGGPRTTAGDAEITGAPLAVLSHRLWRSRFGEQPDIVGMELMLEGGSATVVGVMPPGWDRLMEADLWMPLLVSRDAASREDHHLDVVGRLAEGTDLDAARRDAVRVAQSLAELHPRTNEGWSARLVPVKESLLGEGRIRAGWVMLGAVGLLLLLACVSVSNLLIARASTRGMEMSVRVALGAGVRRLVRQLLVESVVIGVLAAVAGIMIAFAVLPVLRALTPADTPRIEAAAVDAHVMVFAVVVGLLTGLVFGLAPVLHAVKRDPGSTLRAGRGQTDGRGERLRALLVAGQVAMTVTLLVAAGLLGATFLRMQQADTGLPVAQVWAVPLTMSAPRYTGDQRAATASEIRTRLVTLPGITAAGSTNTLPFGGGGTVISIAVEGRPGTPESAPFARWRAVGEGFFEAVDAAALEGRLLESADHRDAAEPVVVVGQSLAARIAGNGESAVGRRIAMGWDGTNWRRVVGVVRDIEDLGPDEEPPLTFYFPGEGGMSAVVILFRTAAGSAPPAATAIRDLIHDIQPDLPVPAIEPLDVRARRRLAGERFYFTIVGSFSIVALLLAVMGVYGVTRFSVAQRVREVCVRIALGAQPRDVVRLLLGRSLIMAAAGVVAGLVLALALTTTIESLLFDTSARDPWVFLAAAVISGAACAAATWLPARRAARISPAGILSS